MTIYLLKYNNYYNRIIKRYSTIDELLDRDDVTEIGTFQNVNFNPGDGVATQLTLNYTPTYHQPNYLVVEDTSQPGIITLSSWFILDAQYVRLGQYVLTLRRDLVNDLWHLVSESPIFVEKATLPASSPFIFNNENMTYNQVKTKEFLLHDETRIPWIVGYLNKDFSATGDDKITILSPALETQVRQELAGWEEYEYSDMIDTGKITGIYDNSITYRMEYFYTTTSGTRSRQIRWKPNKEAPAADTNASTAGSYLFQIKPSRQVGYRGSSLTSTYYLEPFLSGLSKTSFANMDYMSYVETGIYSQSELESIYNSENGAIYKVGNKLYRIEMKLGSSATAETEVAIPQTSQLGQRFQIVGNEMLAAENVFQSLYNNPFKMGYLTYDYTVEVYEIADGTIDIEIPGDRPHTTNSPYDIFCIPYGNIGWGGDLVRTNSEYAWKAAQAIIGKAGPNINLYDIQLLPYCPIRDRMELSVVEGATIIRPKEGDITIKYRPSGASIDTVYTGIAWVIDGDFSFSVNANLYEGLPELAALPATAVERKVANETDLYRLTSPNYNGVFEFSVVKNGGLSMFDIDCSYKPYQPYIRISPRFSGLYGQDFNDARGLVLGGDFSLPQMSNEWIAYQNQNKNYQVMFDRQIANMDVNNSIQRKMEIGNIATGIIAGGTTTGIISSMLPGRASTLGGIATAAGIGGAVSAVGGALDYRFNEQLRQEARDYTIDQFGYQLGNIMARPDSLTKVSSFNPNNKFFPVLEYYTATEMEKEALRNKLYYNGMTVMVIGTIAEYLQTEPSYIKGRLIRLNDDMEDYHIVNALADELYQGVYV